MNNTKNIIEKYLKLKLSKEELLEHLDGKKHNDSSSHLALVVINDIKNLIRAGLENKINKSAFSDWIDFVWFSGYYGYEEKNQEVIAEIMNDLEDVELLSDKEYEELLNRVNTDILQGKYSGE